MIIVFALFFSAAEENKETTDYTTFRFCLAPVADGLIIMLLAGTWDFLPQEWLKEKF
ncbi:MAG: hypothetical protein GY756_19760 [bacterium]|nr:hypothetical protein [bacterium]